LVAVFEKDKAIELQKRLSGIRVVAGMEGLIEAASHSGADFTMLAMTGNEALQPALAAIQAKNNRLANKELLISAGELITSTARACSVDLLPVDGRHQRSFNVYKAKSQKTSGGSS
jgi:1-deoxy-D-xylulose-5-phosphate reductoisomerase